MREKIVRVLRIISYSLAAFGAAWFGEPLENVAALSATCVPVQHYLRREHVCERGGGKRAHYKSGQKDECKNPAVGYPACLRLDY